MATKIDILYEDNHVVVVYKPRGVLSQADGSTHEDLLTLLKNYIKEKYHKEGNVYLGLVHRLDMNTAGVMVYAKTSKAAARLSLQICNHLFEKKYLAIVEGILTEGGILSTRLAKNTIERKSYTDQRGQQAILEYQVLDHAVISKQEVTLVDISLKTGRFHQVRAQFSSIGHPLYGDKKYGSRHLISSNHFPLECYHLGFYHPISKEWMVFEQQTLDLKSF